MASLRNSKRWQRFGPDACEHRSVRTHYRDFDMSARHRPLAESGNEKLIAALLHFDAVEQ